MVTSAASRLIWHAITQNRRLLRKEQAAFLRGVGPRRVLEIGSGQRRRGRYFQSAVDLAGADTTFVMSDADAALGHLRVDVTDPSADLGRFDAVLCCNVLEHVFDLEAAVEGLARLVRDDGALLASTPFVYPLHDEPGDYWRPTQHALQRLFSQHWDQVEVRWTGPRRFPFQLFVTARGGHYGH
jgi:SAM-dependent methyltransferase